MANYETAKAYLGAAPSWITGENAKRYTAYDFYDSLVSNNPEQFRLVLRGDEEDPVYMPTARKIVRTLARYIAKDLGFAVDMQSQDLSAGGDPEQPADPQALSAAISAYGDLFNRERFFSNFRVNKKFGLQRGDMMIYVLGDPSKPDGKKISIKFLDPRKYFPLTNKSDATSITGCDIVDVITDPDDSSKQYISRQRYLRGNSDLYPGYNPEAPNYEAPVIFEHLWLEMDKWQEEPKTVKTISPATPLPQGITHLPVYHIKFGGDTDEMFGESVLQGLERIFLAINQAVTDEALTLAMAGLGFYHSSSTPVDEDGNPTDWVIGPKRVVETGREDIFERVQGVSSITPSQDHVKGLENQISAATGINDVAIGNVDASVAESGVALALRMAPILDETDEYDDVIRDVLAQFFYDLKFWLQAYEGIALDETIVVKPSFGSKLPRNLDNEFKHVYDLFANGIISKQWMISWLQENFGYDFPSDMIDQIREEQAADAASSDPYAQGDPTEDPYADEGAPADEEMM